MGTFSEDRDYYFTVMKHEKIRDKLAAEVFDKYDDPGEYQGFLQGWNEALKYIYKKGQITGKIGGLMESTKETMNNGVSEGQSQVTTSERLKKE